ncbi:MAG: DoxX family protein [Nitrospirae bacterium GWD2_57_9]|nr:MAG: DoxX family protein [Nitrospirae bacterium GWD2_57_9]OGW49731.1 MAG: DoxX family protein [Nitrospirae bacterium GWC2_57_9]
MKKIFAVQDQTVALDLVLLCMRIVVGYAFILHGWGKIQSPFTWMGSESPVPTVFQALAAIAEFGGGFSLILGLLTRLGALGIDCNMMVAVFMHRFVMGDPFVNATGGRSYELAVAYLLIALLLVVVGPGRFSLDRRIFGRA